MTRVRADPGPSVRQRGVAAVRQAQRLRALAGAPGPRLAAVEDLTAGLGQVPARLYRPALEPRPLVVFLHGGMWVIGDLDSHDRACRRLAARAGVAVLAVDFRRPPEHKWPAAVDDAVDVVRWAVSEAAGLAETVRAAGPVAVAGDSSGGNLAALACLRLRDEGGPLPAAQILVTPNTDLTLSQPSARDKATGWGLDADDVAWGAELWVPGPSWLADPGVSPLYAADLSGLPPAVVVTAEHDPLRDEGEAYAAKLRAAGVAVTTVRYDGVVHDFMLLNAMSESRATRAAIAQATAHLRAALGTGEGPNGG